MIQVQIASQIHLQGVDQIRWVLIEPADPAKATTPVAAPGLASPQASSAPSTPFVPSAPFAPAPAAGWTLYLFKSLLMLAGLLLALWLAQREFGPPGWPGSASAQLPQIEPQPKQNVLPAVVVEVVAERQP